MGLRGYKKDHLEKNDIKLMTVSHRSELPVQTDPLRFWISHYEKNHLVDLTILREGQGEKRTNGHWAGPFTGRPGLILQIAPALQDQLTGKAELSAAQMINQLRAWWRLLDAVEGDALRAGISLPKVESVAQLSDIHRQRAFEGGMNRKTFSTFLRVANLTRKALHLPELHWRSPDSKDPKRHLAPDWQVAEIRREIRREWFGVLDRWTRTEQLLAGQLPKNDAESNLLRNYRHYQSVRERTLHPCPKADDILDGLPRTSFNRSGLIIDIMRSGFYPDGWDIRVAFHRCLSETGWNPSTLLAIDVSLPYVEVHPKDPSRYVMTAFKARSKSEQTHVGLMKTQGGPAAILHELIIRTEPLRKQLKSELEKTKSVHAELQKNCASPIEIEKCYREIQRIELGVRSPWLYLERWGIQWLEQSSYSNLGGGGEYGRRTFLKKLIAKINERLPSDRKVDPGFQPSDFRDAYAAFGWKLSGGSVLHVMKALGHKNLRSTSGYLDNSLLNDESQRLYRNFSNELWREIAENSRVDPTIIAKATRDGSVSSAERQRLQDYRELRKSRLGIGCLNPHAPPKRVAPTFVADGKRMCATQRCMLCIEHAVIFPESIDGLCMRFEELQKIKLSISIPAWLDSQFPEELENTQKALDAFSAEDVSKYLEFWAARVSSESHKIPELMTADVDRDAKNES